MDKEKSTKTYSLAIASMVMGIVSIPLLFIRLIGFISGCVLAVIAIVLGIVSLNKISKNKMEGKGMAIAGIVTGGVTILLFIILIIFAAILISTGVIPMDIA